MMETPLTRMLGIGAPVIQAPIGPWPELVAAVSAAGGLGILQCSWLDEASLRDAIQRTRGLTDRPFGINLVSDESRARLLGAALDEGVPVITLSGTDPAPHVDRIHDARAIVTYCVGTAEEARRAADGGVDAVVAQGWEAGGHVHGRVATLALIPAVKSAVGALPVIAAGGVADGRGLAAVMALGADAAWMGTRFIASHEAMFTGEYKRAVLAADEARPVRTTLFDVGWPDSPHRVLPNSTYREWEAAGRPARGLRPGEGEIIASAPGGEAFPRYGIAEPTVDMTGDLEALAQYAGQSSGLVNTVRPAGEIVHDTVAAAEEILRRLSPDRAAALT
jgi:nitronate monooxygenase